MEEREGRPALCIVLPKATAQQVKGMTEQGSDAIFDETLHMSGEQVLLPGLSVATDGAKADAE